MIASTMGSAQEPKIMKMAPNDILDHTPVMRHSPGVAVRIEIDEIGQQAQSR